MTTDVTPPPLPGRRPKTHATITVRLTHWSSSLDNIRFGESPTKTLSGAGPIEEDDCYKLGKGTLKALTVKIHREFDRSPAMFAPDGSRFAVGTVYVLGGIAVVHLYPE